MEVSLQGLNTQRTRLLNNPGFGSGVSALNTKHSHQTVCNMFIRFVLAGAYIVLLVHINTYFYYVSSLVIIM